MTCALCTPILWYWRVRRGPVCAPVLGRCWLPRPEVWR